MYLRGSSEHNFNPFRQSLCLRIILYKRATDDERLGFTLSICVIQVPAHNVISSAKATPFVTEEYQNKHLIGSPLPLCPLSRTLNQVSTSGGSVGHGRETNRALLCRS